jgi:hypothetical protein
MHLDGSFGIYSNLDPNTLFVQKGQNVNPGEPIGIAKLNLINFKVIIFNSQHKIESAVIKLFTDDLGASILTNEKECNVNHPDKVIEQEMTKSQIKKLKKKQQKSD